MDDRLAALMAQLRAGVAGTLHAAAERLEPSALVDLRQAKDEFISTTSHELRTPLTSILGYTELLVDGDLGELSPAQRKAVQSISRNAARLRQQVEDLLFFTEHRSANDLPHTTVALKEPVAAAISAQVSFDDKAVLISRSVDPAARVQGDLSLLTRLVANLVSNAVKFTPAGGEVRVSTRVEGDKAVLEVSDTGIGMSPADHERIFDKFFRSQRSYGDATAGAGLGLAIVKEISIMHGASLELRSSEGEGSCFRVAFPLAP